MRPRSESAPTISLSISFAAPACMRAGISSEKSSSRKSGMSAMSRVVRKAHVIFAHRAREPGFAARLRERAVAGDERAALFLRVLEMPLQHLGIGELEIIRRLLHFVLMEHFAVTHD